MKKIDNLFNSNELIYHYTKIQTAFEYILDTNKLKLSKRLSSNDPIENFSERIITNSFYGHDDTERPSNKDVYEVSRFIKEKIKNAKQICFCTNIDNDDFQNINILPYEYYGFLKPRMWDQYGDKYNGVCLVFDKRKLKANNPDVYSKKIEYITYNEFYRISDNINLNRLKDIGLDEYRKDSFNRLQSQSFFKHQDYSGENEYRFISFSETETYLDIGNSLEAIIISERNLSDFARNWFNEYASKNNMKLFFINWTNSGVNMQSKAQYDESLESVKKLINQSKKG